MHCLDRVAEALYFAIDDVIGELPANDNQLRAMLKPYPRERLAMWPLDRRVENVKNEAPELAEPLAASTRGASIPDDSKPLFNIS